MAKYLRKSMPSSYRILCTGDWHVGSIQFHDTAAALTIQRVCRDDDLYLLDMGDSVEGAKVDHPFFNPDNLRPGLLDIHKQADAYCEIVSQVPREKWIGKGMGNHDYRLLPNFDVHRYICERLGVPMGGYQTWYDLGPVRIFAYHGRQSMPQGAKDWVQREANQLAWLKRTLDRCGADSCHVHLMGHVHALRVLHPEEKYGLLCDGLDVKAHYYREQDATIHGRPYVPSSARWYALTGTMRRGGSFEVDAPDYSEVAGFGPAPVGYVVIHVRDGVVADVEKVIL